MFLLSTVARLRQGSDLHHSIVSHLLGEEAIVDKEIVPYMESVSAELNHFHDIQSCEMLVEDASLGYRGVIDCVASYKR